MTVPNGLTVRQDVATPGNFAERVLQDTGDDGGDVRAEGRGDRTARVVQGHGRADLDGGVREGQRRVDTTGVLDVGHDHVEKVGDGLDLTPVGGELAAGEPDFAGVSTQPAQLVHVLDADGVLEPVES
ncbi:hypothetical protein B4N89_40605 [Embleya scabrispora]|uniref:Uncharacterized protein n=1 Tax=Embleya scabrispora TaxID=159449 RepID=A0A1T3NJ81_9ACTN|nr:hypothetical protein B4N89_40605 [Embleya scabrispora]